MSECIGRLRHVYVPKVGENHRPAIKVFHDFTEISITADDVHLGSDLDVLVAWHLVYPACAWYTLCYAMQCYLLNAFSEGSAVGYCAYLGPSILNTFHSNVHAFFFSIRFLGDLLWDNPFLGQGQDLSSFGLTKIHTTYGRYVVHKASLYSTLQSLFEPVFFFWLSIDT